MPPAPSSYRVARTAMVPPAPGGSAPGCPPGTGRSCRAPGTSRATKALQRIGFCDAGGASRGRPSPGSRTAGRCAARRPVRPPRRPAPAEPNVRLGRCRWPPNTCQSGGRPGASTTSIGSTGIFSRPSGGVPIVMPCPSVSAMTRSGLSASTITDRLYASCLPCLSTSVSTRMRATSAAGSRTWQEWITGLGTASRSLTPPLSGEEIPSTASGNPPAGFRMSRRSVTVSSAGPRSIEEYERPR